MKDISLKELLEAGCHFGHQTNRWNPKAAGYIYGAREGVHIVDLVQTREGLLKAAEYLSGLAANGGSVLFVGTKRQAKPIVEEAVKKVSEVASGNNFYYLLERWPGGLLTNFDVIKKNNLDSILTLRDALNANKQSLQSSASPAGLNFVTKKEKLLAQRKLDKYDRIFGGLVGLTKLPDAVFFVDIKREDGAVREAVRSGVTICGIVDTNVDPTPVTYQIPANDDAVGSIKIIIDFLVDAWIEGLGKKAKEEKKEEKKQED